MKFKYTFSIFHNFIFRQPRVRPKEVRATNEIIFNRGRHFHYRRGRYLVGYFSTLNNCREDVCESKVEIVTPYWASNSNGKVDNNIIINNNDKNNNIDNNALSVTSSPPPPAITITATITAPSVTSSAPPPPPQKKQ